MSDYGSMSGAPNPNLLHRRTLHEDLSCISFLQCMRGGHSISRDTLQQLEDQYPHASPFPRDMVPGNKRAFFADDDPDEEARQWRRKLTQYKRLESAEDRRAFRYRLAAKIGTHEATVIHRLKEAEGGSGSLRTPAPTKSRAVTHPLRQQSLASASHRRQTPAFLPISPPTPKQMAPEPGEFPTFSEFLTRLGVPHLFPVFKGLGYKSAGDLDILRNCPQITQEVVLKAVREDPRVILRDWSVVHSAFNGGNIVLAPVSD
ncbi:hypothetical protein BXZ70DRAFT_1008173 [Cristinia sonorae]|uniref:Uncharacterized protein n=1 Tax=Cristinia sonorae TaxID=1940300 RepID=A0A8K0UPR7_9AGAR|nr:hypothetical protein BXZ70DRAFT_1008173 [Cristinia sonorae]